MSDAEISLSKKIDNLLSKRDVMNFLSYRGVAFDTRMLDSMKDFILEQMHNFIRDIEITESIIQSKGLDIVVRAFCGSDDPIVSKTNLEGVPSLVIQHGAIADISGYAPVIATKIAVWGDMCKNQLVTAGVPVEKMVITGNPHFDSILDERRDREHICKDLNLDPKKKVFLLTTPGNLKTHFVLPHPILEYDEKIAIEVIKLMQEFKDDQLVIKIHPSEDDSLYKQLLIDNNCSNVVITKTSSLYDLLGICELLIMGWASTTGLEAMLFDKPIIYLDSKSMNSTLPYIESNAALVAYNKNDLKAAIIDVIDTRKVQIDLKKNRDKFVSNYAYKQDGKASERVIDLIYKLIKEN